jgi:uncharacterized membrane protein
MTEESTSSATDLRIAALERRVAELEARSAGAVPPRDRPMAPGPRQFTVSTPPRPAARSGDAAGPDFGWTAEDWFRRGEGLLGRAGVVLVVVGMIFLFRYAVERGWLGPELRIATGLLIGGGLLGAGLRYFAGRLRYRQILMGGGVIILFLTGLAASELYGLVSATATLLFHGLVAVAAFTIAARQRDTVLASIGSLGALLPPAFLLHDTVAGPVLWLYLLLMASWAALLVARHPPGAFGILAAVAAVLATLRPVPPEAATRIAALAMLAAVWLGFAVLPLLRSRLSWAAPLRPGTDSTAGVRFLQPLLVTAAVAGACHARVWPGPHAFEAALAVAVAGFALLAVGLFRSRTAPADVQPGSGYAHALLTGDDFAAALAAATASLALLAVAALEPAIRFPALSAVAVMSYLAAPRLRAPVLALLAHALHAAVIVAFARSIETLAVAPAFDTLALGFAAVAAIAGVLLWQARTRAERLACGAGIYVIVHVLLATELGAVPGAPWLASMSYAVVGSALILTGLSYQQLRLQQAGLLTLALLVLRLFAYDLATADMGVRIVLFLACGFAFLVLSYLFRGRQSAA